MRRASLILLIVLTLGSSTQAGTYLRIIWPSNPGPSAREMAARDARREIDAAQNTLRLAHAKAMQNHPLAREIQTAQAELKKSDRELAAARNKVKAKLAEMPEVRNLVNRVHALDGRIANEKDSAVRTQLATERLAIRKKLSTMESEAMNADVYVNLGAAGVVDANKMLRALQEQHRLLMLQDPTFASAKARLDAAQRRMAQVGR
jgi:predicted RNase H-like nuclease (RuvC/YqgF family)